MNVLDTLQYMKPDIKVLVWDNDIDRIEYNENETYKPTKEEILSVDQNLVKQFVINRDNQLLIDNRNKLRELLGLND